MDASKLCVKETIVQTQDILFEPSEGMGLLEHECFAK